MLAQCPRFEGEGGEYADAGTKRHGVLSRLLSDDTKALADLPEDERDALEWAAEYVQLHAPTSDYPLELEQKRTWIGVDFSERTGTPDVVCGPVIFDLKWRWRDYGAQMADYALERMDAGHPTVTVHLLFGDSKRAQVLKFDRESAENLISPIIERAQDPNARPKPCDYCGWCKHAFQCEPHLRHAETVARGYSDLEQVQNWHPSKMETAEDLALALWVWRKVLKPWGASIEHHALEAAQKKGLTLPGFEIATKRGKTYCTDVSQAFTLAGLPQDQFLKCCDLRLNTSKRYPDKAGIVDLYAAANGMKKAPAKRELLNKLGCVMATGSDSVSLRLTGDPEDSED
jgi:hypothetical protein